MKRLTKAVEGIRILDETGNADNLQEELGDVLMQVFLHSQIAREEGLFDLDDVVDGISRKMISAILMYSEMLRRILRKKYCRTGKS